MISYLSASALIHKQLPRCWTYARSLKLFDWITYDLLLLLFHSNHGILLHCIREVVTRLMYT